LNKEKGETYWVTTVSFFVLLSMIASSGKGKNTVSKPKKTVRISEKVITILTMSLGVFAFAIL